MSTQDKYRKLHPPEETIDEGEHRFDGREDVRTAAAVIFGAFERDNKDQIVISGIGNGIQVAIAAVEATKRRVPGLHQLTRLGRIQQREIYEPLEEGLDIVTTTKQVTAIFITLSKAAVAAGSIGYQPPLPAPEVKKETTPEAFAFDLVSLPSRSGQNNHGYAPTAHRAHHRDGGVGGHREFQSGRGYEPRPRGRGRGYDGNPANFMPPQQHHPAVMSAPAGDMAGYPPIYMDMTKQQQYGAMPGMAMYPRPMVPEGMCYHPAFRQQAMMAIPTPYGAMPAYPGVPVMQQGPQPGPYPFPFVYAMPGMPGMMPYPAFIMQQQHAAPAKDATSAPAHHGVPPETEVAATEEEERVVAT